MTAIGFKCPGCGGFVKDHPDQDILVCERCGTTLTKAVSEYDLSLRYLKEKDIREEAARKEAYAKKRKDSWKALLILGAIVVAGMIFIYLRERGIL